MQDSESDAHAEVTEDAASIDVQEVPEADTQDLEINEIPEEGSDEPLDEMPEIEKPNGPPEVPEIGEGEPADHGGDDPADIKDALDEYGYDTSDLGRGNKSFNPKTVGELTDTSSTKAAEAGHHARDDMAEEGLVPTNRHDTKEERSDQQSQEKLRFGELDSHTEYERNGYFYETDELGRVETVHANLDLGKGVRTKHQGEVGKMGLEGDEGGHLIGTRFKGSPEGVNLVPQDMNLNRSDWAKMENEWADALKSDQEVEVVIHTIYNDGNRPLGFYVYDTIGSEEHERYFTNMPHGAIDAEKE